MAGESSAGPGTRPSRSGDASTGQEIGAPFMGHTDIVVSVALSSDGQRIVSGSNDKTVRIWDASTGREIGAPLTGHINGVVSVAFSPDGRQIVSGSSDTTIRLWDAATGQEDRHAAHRAHAHSEFRRLFTRWPTDSQRLLRHHDQAMGRHHPPGNRRAAQGSHESGEFCGLFARRPADRQRVR